MEELKIEYISIDAIMPYANNARAHGDADVDAIMASIREFGFNDPIGIWKGIIVEGHGRLLAAKRLGLETVPVIHLDHLTDEQRRAYALAHNKTAELSAWDFNVLDAELKEISGIDMSAFGFEAEEDEGEVTEDSFEPEADEENPVCQRGNIYELGRHRLMCGDSADQDDVKKLMGGELADLLITDPPYGVNYDVKNIFLNKYNKGTRVQREIENDGMNPEEMYQFWVKAFKNIIPATKKRMSFYIFSPQGRDQLSVLLAIKDSGLMLRHGLVWVKNNHVLGRSDYYYKHEPIFYGWKPDGNHSFFADYDISVFEDQINLQGLKKDDLIDLARRLMSELEAKDDVIREDKPLKSDLHPTMKPVKLIARLIRNSTEAGQAVLDLFGGSGTTLIAAEQLNRRCFMMEYDPHYCDVIIERWETFTGEKAVLLE